MNTDTTEKGLEAHIIQHLSLVNAFEERHFSQYNRIDCLDEALLFKFLNYTQPKEVAKLKVSQGANYEQRIRYFVPAGFSPNTLKTIKESTVKPQRRKDAETTYYQTWFLPSSIRIKPYHIKPFLLHALNDFS